jgi:hypothetical protein
VRLASEGFVGSLLTDHPPERLGAAWLALLDGLANGPIDPVTYALLDRVDGDPGVPQAAQRREHVEMFVLLGDPALRLPDLPADVALKSPDPVRPGTALAVEGTLPPRLAGARVRVTLERTAGSVPPDLEPLPKGAGAARDRATRANHERANQFVVAEAEVTAQGRDFAAGLEVPAKLPGHGLVLRAYAATDRDDGQGVLRLSAGR